MDLNALIRKYSTPGPRYTSYPTAPQWSDAVGESEYRQALSRVGADETLAIYVHLPFCEKLCYYCGCNIQITHDKSRSRSYVEQVIAELGRVAESLRSKSVVQISWGGGTPTFLTLEEIRMLQTATLSHFRLQPGAEVSIEIDPRVTTEAQLRLLRELGFNRTSLGVQDFNPQVQEAVNRIQPAEQTHAILELCRKLGFEGINFDLIYGLPFQTFESFERTVDQVIAMRPDRIALYNYARLPSLLKHQTILEKHPMPDADSRVSIFTMALDRLTAAGYAAIGMDHFALKEDSLSRALDEGSLYRNFMGYTVRHANHMIGVGASSIGEVGGGFFQNIKKASDYESAIVAGRLPTHRGMVLSEDDLQRKWIIQSLMCRFQLDPVEFERAFHLPFQKGFESELLRLQPFEGDGILEEQSGKYAVTELGRLFVRNVAMVFDAYLSRQKATFSRTV